MRKPAGPENQASTQRSARRQNTTQPKGKIVRKCRPHRSHGKRACASGSAMTGGFEDKQSSQLVAYCRASPALQCTPKTPLPIDRHIYGACDDGPCNRFPSFEDHSASPHVCVARSQPSVRPPLRPRPARDFQFLVRPKKADLSAPELSRVGTKYSKLHV